MSLVGLILVVTLLVLAPGWLLLNAAFPPRVSRLSWIERAYLTVASGAMSLSLVGVVLGLLPHGTHGFFSTFATGLPLVELVVSGVSAAAFWVGLRRGAYPRLAARLPSQLVAAGKVERAW